MQPEVLVTASMGCAFISALVMVNHFFFEMLFTVKEAYPHGARNTIGGFCGHVASVALGLWITSFSGLPEGGIALRWWIGGTVLLLGIFMLTHGVIRRHIPALSMGIFAFVVGCWWR